MESDFGIHREDGHWVVQALTERGAQFVREDQRFEEGRAEFSEAEAIEFHRDLSRRLLFASLPDGRPGGGNSSMLLRLLLLFMLTVLPLLLLVALL